MASKWVAPHLTGGLGNRLFEFAAAAGAAEKWDISCVFFLPKCGHNDHAAFDTIFNLFPTIETVFSVHSWDSILEEPSGCFKYTPLPDKAPADNSVICGWRQTPLYFPTGPILPNWDNVLIPKMQTNLLQKYDLLSREKQEDTVLLHVRLGDYKMLPHHQIPVHAYYQECLDRISKEGKKRIMLFSDEPDLCKDWISNEVTSRGLSFIVCEELTEVEPLWLMSKCLGGAITANSTYSWWGAYFAKQNATKPFPAFFPDVWGKGLPPARDVVPSWGTAVPITL